MIGSMYRVSRSSEGVVVQKCFVEKRKMHFVYFTIKKVEESIVHWANLKESACDLYNLEHFV